MEVLVGQVLVGGPWSLAIYCKGHQHWIFLDSGPLASELVLVLKFQLCPRPLYLFWGPGRWETASGCSSRPQFSPPGMLRLHGLWFWCVISEKQLSTSSNRIGAVKPVCGYSASIHPSVGPSDDVIVSSCAFLGSFCFL